MAQDTRKTVRPQADWPVSTTYSSDFDALQPAPASALPRRDRSGRARWLIGFVYLAMLASNFWLIADARRHAIDGVRVANANLALAVSERVEASLAEVRNILDGLVYALERSDLTPAALEQLQPILVNHVVRGDQLRGLFVYDAQGRWIATSEPRWSTNQNNADRAYFRHHRDNPSEQPLVGPPIVSRSSGQWVVPVSRRLNDADGRFAGVVLATLNLDHFRKVLDRLDLGDGAITLIVADHTMVRRPFRAADVGQPSGRSPAMAQMRDAGWGEVVSPVDGVVRFFSIERSRNYPVQVIVASSKAEVLHKWWWTSFLQTLWVLLLCLALRQANIYTRRALQERKRAEAGLRDAHGALAAMNERLKQLAQFDELTALPNRRYFDRRFARAFKEARRDQRSLAVVMVDVDEFKKYNDHYGHVPGDQCLARVAATLRAVVRRPEDFVARYGGEEMVLLLRNTDAAGATLVAEAARQAVWELAVPHSASALGQVSVSLGVAAMVPGPADTPQALLKWADAALYEAKRGGRNRVQASAGEAQAPG